MEQLNDVLERLYELEPDDILDSDIEADCEEEYELLTRRNLRSLPVEEDSILSSVSVESMESEENDVLNESDEEKLTSLPAEEESMLSSIYVDSIKSEASDALFVNKNVEGKVISFSTGEDSILSSISVKSNKSEDIDVLSINENDEGKLMSFPAEEDSILSSTFVESIKTEKNDFTSVNENEEGKLRSLPAEEDSILSSISVESIKSEEIDMLSVNEKDKESDSPPLKKQKKSTDQCTWNKVVPVGRQQIVYGEKPYVKSRSLNAQPSALNCFLSLVSMDALQLLVDMTNKNYQRKTEQRIGRKTVKTDSNLGPSPAKRTSHALPWTDVTIAEMKAFIGMLIAMGLVRLPGIDMYWRKSCAILRTVGFREVMSRDRFNSIYRHIHFADPECEQVINPDNTEPQTRDKLLKIRRFSEMIRKNCMEKYAVGRNVAIDESLIPFKGRVAFRQFLPAKRSRYGIKVWVLAESETSYVSNFQFYVGRDPQADPNQKVELGRAVVMSLMEPFLNEGRHLYMDNFYTSQALLEELYNNGTYACGTVRQNRRGFPKDLLIKTTGPDRHARGYFDWRMCGNTLCYSWYDNKPVYIMTTIHLPDDKKDDKSSTHMVKRRWKSRETKEVPCPSVIKDYNRYMGGVDGNDQMRKYYNLNRRSRVWYRKVFGYLLEVCVHNARVMLENIQGKRVNGIEFRETLITALIGNYRNVTVTFPPQPTSDSLRHDKTVWHMPVFGPGHDRKRNRCRYCCRRAAVAKEEEGTILSRYHSIYYCSACAVPLCVNSRECFRKYHEEVNFWP